MRLFLIFPRTFYLFERLSECTKHHETPKKSPVLLSLTTRQEAVPMKELGAFQLSDLGADEGSQISPKVERQMVPNL